MDLKAIYDTLHGSYGPQHWWPAETPFEVMAGAVLTQNTSWSNVEKAIVNLKRADSLSAEAIVVAAHEQLAFWLKPSGYFNIKARRLRHFCLWYLQQGGFDALSVLDTDTLRNGLLSVHGIGPETADDIALYAFERPVFVIDAYTRRLFSRLGLIKGAESYETLRGFFEATLKRGVRKGGKNGRADPDLQSEIRLFKDYHALIVRHAKTICQKRPRCGQCCLAAVCPGAGLNGRHLP